MAIPWVPVRKPEENLNDEQWRTRETFGEVEHPELGRSFTYALADARRGMPLAHRSARAADRRTQPGGFAA